MIKYSIIFLCLFLPMLTVSAQQNPPSFEGKTFELNNYDNIEFQQLGNLTFTNFHVESSEANQLGLKKAAYKVIVIDESLHSFSFTMESIEHGKITWFGTKSGENISGDLIWAKKNEAPIHSAFSGKVR